MPLSSVVMSDEVQTPLAKTGNKGAAEFVEFTRARQSMSRRIAESKATIPHIYLQVEADLTALLELRAGVSADGPAPTVNDLVIKAAALALDNHPRVNSSYRDGGIELHSRINIGVAVDTADGSLTPVIPDANLKDLEAIAAEVRNLSARARSGEITPPELAGATFSISNLGMLGITSSEPIVNPGQAAKLAVGAVLSRPVARDGEVTVGEIMKLDLSCDHRVLHGGEAARFLGEVKANLEDRELLG